MIVAMRHHRARRPPNTSNVVWLIIAASIALGLVFYFKWRTGSIAEPPGIEQPAQGR